MDAPAPLRPVGVQAVDERYEACATTERPTLLIVESHIGFGAPSKQDTAAAHGEPLGPDEVRAAKRSYGWPEDARFLVPKAVREHFRQGLGARGRSLREAWMARLDEYRKAYPALADELVRMQRRELPKGWDANLPSFRPTQRASRGAMPRPRS